MQAYDRIQARRALADEIMDALFHALVDGNTPLLGLLVQYKEAGGDLRGNVLKGALLSAVEEAVSYASDDPDA